MAKIPAKNDVLFKRAWKKSLLNSTANGQSLDDLAKLCGLADSSLYSTASEERPDVWISMRRFLAILPELKDLSVLDYLESIVRPRRVAYQDPDESGPVCSTRVTAQLMHKTASILESHAQSEESSPGVWYDDEADELTRHIDDLTRCAQAYKTHVLRVAKPRPSRHALKAAVNQ